MFVTRVLLVLALAFAACAHAATPSPHAIDLPPWFQETFLDFREDVRDAAKQGKRVMIYFGQDGCPYCTQLMRANFGQADIAAKTRERFLPIALNIWGDRETTWIDGVKRTEKELTAFLRVQFTPTLVFLDEQGAVALRLNGYQHPPRFRLVLDYATKAQAGGETLAQFLAKHPVPRERAIDPVAGLFRELPIRLADRPGADMLIVFDDSPCDACAELHDAFRKSELQRGVKRLDAVRINVSGRKPVTSHEGVPMTEADYAKSKRVTFLPTLLFLSGEGREIFRVEGYLRPFHLSAAIDYVASGAYRAEPSYQRFIQARAERMRAEGRAVDLW